MPQSFELLLDDIHDLEAFHDLAYRVFGFPSYYGRNLDAFWDCLTDLAGDIDIHIRGFDARTSPTEIAGYIALLREFAALERIGRCELHFDHP